MIPLPRPEAPLVEDWFQRHRRPANFLLHLIGIPPTILGFLMIPLWLSLASVSLFLFALTMFVGGYLLQFLGHLVDGSEPGEVAYLRSASWRRVSGRNFAWRSRGPRNRNEAAGFRPREGEGRDSSVA